MNKESIEKIKKYPYKDGVISIIGASITIIVGLLTLLTCIYESDIIVIYLFCFYCFDNIWIAVVMDRI